MNKKTISLLCLSAMGLVYGQQDSLTHKNIEEVVITGQYNPQSINKSIYKVEVINEEQIKNMAATNVADVLNQSLNIIITPDTKSGNSTANILGLDGSYVKVLIDNIPVVGDTGLGSNIDLTKLGLNNIERIEIVQGSMGVEYGNGALAGVINIITKKTSQNRLSLRASLQEETVNTKYDIRKKGNGRHIQNLNLGYNIDKNWYAGVTFNHNEFMGYDGDKEGYKYFGTDNKRGKQWNPKDQYDVSGLIRYSKNNTSFYYKLSYLHEKFNFYNPEVVMQPLNDGNGGRTYRSMDREYNTDRWIHQFNIQSHLGHIKYMGDFSYQTQDRKYYDYIYYIPERQIFSKGEEKSYFNTDVIYSRGMFSNFLNNDKFDFQIGYELDHTNGYAALIAGDFFGESVARKIFTYANFISAEWSVTDRVSLRPGARMTFSNHFDRQFNYSLSARYKIGNNYNLRAVFGTANRYPTYDELFTYFVNTNHNIQGDPNLKPETGYSVNVAWDLKTTPKDGLNINYSLSGIYLDLKDRISQVLVEAPVTYRYVNLDLYKSLLFTAGIDMRTNQFGLGAKVSLNGISQEMKEYDATSPTDFKYSFQAAVNASYKLKNIGTLFSLYYKYTGEERSYVYTGSKYDLGVIDSYNLMDFIITQPFCNNKFEFTVGVKNLFNVTTINNNTIAANSYHSSVSETINLFYGRSYLARLTYQF